MAVSGHRGFNWGGGVRTALVSLLALGALTPLARAERPAPRGGARGAPPPAPPPRAPASATGQDRRYALANGCYAVRSRSTGKDVVKDLTGYRASAGSAGTAEGFRMQATALGSYLFYGRKNDFMAGSGNSVKTAGSPGPSSDWRVDVSGNAFKISLPSAHKVLALSGDRLVLADSGPALFSFDQSSGCAVYPEVETGASGSPLRGKTPWGEVKGLIDLHMHMMAFEFLGGRAHCGRPWSRYGAPDALKDCPDHAATNGCGAVLENVLYGNPARCHDPGGWPTFKGWPDHKSLTHEQSYYRWVERAYMAGLRVFVNLFVENKVLCEVYPLKKNSCNEMNAVRLQNRDINALQDYIDAQHGGPGRGWFRIVTSAAQARRVIAQGKLAVIKGIEISEPFDCRVYNDVPQCDRAQIDRELAEVYGFGVRQMELINKFDNALAGVAGDNGETGVVVNGGNRLETGKYWQMQACNGPKDEEDKQQIGVYNHDEHDIGSNLLEQFLPLGAAPVYPSNSSCNARGLTDLGEHAVRRLMQRHMIIDPDHLSVRARKSLMSLVEADRYGGVVSSHSWSTPDVESRIYRRGGVITPMQGEAPNWVKHWRETRAKRDKRFYFGFGYGADENGFATQLGPRAGSNVKYPFKSFDGGVTFQRQRSGSRVFDFNKDGVAMYGMFADWYQDLHDVGGPAITRDMARGAEAYLQTWERAEGIGFGCKSGRQHFTRKGLGRMRLRYSTTKLLRRAGQPKTRGDRAWTWCVTRKRNRRRKVVNVLDRKGRVQLIASTAIGHRVLRIRPGVRAKRLRGKARKIGKGLYVRRAGKRARFVYGVRHGRVSFVGLATRTASKSRKRLRAYLKLGKLR